MQVTIPFTIGDSNIDSTNIPENDYSVWSVGTTYNTGDKVIVLSTHSIYESQVDSNVGNDPTAVGSTVWLRLGATNRWKAFDQKISDPVVGGGTTIEYTLNSFSAPPGNMTCFGLKGTSINLTVTDPTDGEVYNQTVTLIDTTYIVDGYTYCFEPNRVKTEAIFDSIPPYASADFALVLSKGSSADLELGQIVVGQEYILGITSYGTTVSIEDYSKKERDDFGNPIIVERAFSKLIDFDFLTPTQEARRTAALLESIRATPAVYSVGTDTEQYGATVYGFFRTWQINLSRPNYSDVTLEVEGLT